RRRIDEAFAGGVRSAGFKKLLKVDLYPYQRKGALFAASAGRSLIADDMGLGKTIQAIAAVEILARTMGLERVLIVCPTSLKHQWKQEIERFSERSAEVVEGLLGRRKALYGTESFYKIVNYEVVHRDMEAIDQWGPEMVILDEAQRIKNWKTRRAQSVKKLDSRYALVLTGTPLENRLEELHSIVEFVDRFHLGPLFRFLAEHQHVDETGRVVGYHNLGRISQSLEPILIRRTKKEVLSELPPRMEKNFFVPMTPQQQQHHEENRETVARIVAKWRRYGFLSETDQRRLMIALQNMRMSCNSTYLLDRKTDFGTKADELLQLLAEVFEQPDAKTVVFSQWVGTHEILLDRLKGAKLDHVLFHGGVPGPKRKGLIKQFKEDPACRVFLSTDAGGVGLNLQHATTVVNMDLPWNPAVLEQRIGRIHRLGQMRPVRVVNFVAQGTIEHGMLSVLSFKKSLFTGVLDGGKDEVFLGGTRLQRFMESVDTATQAIPQPMPVQLEEPNGEDTEEALSGDGRRAKEEGPATKYERRNTKYKRGAGATQGRDALATGWEDVVSAGLSLLDMLGKAVGGQGAEASAAGSKLAGGLDVETDPRTGRQHLKVPMPDGATLQRIADVLSELARRMKG
ncbi:MAG TPA: DEAD/DEAH box helicase, partial [Phycisphaerales bacterium]|nr:DEAD/DEAH box helicase [Phycisphaerales bacterium]